MSRPHDVVEINAIELRTYNSEREFQSAILHDAESAGWSLRYHPYSSMRSTAGFPDLTLVNPERGIAVLVEVKTNRGIVSPPQREWLIGLRAAGLNACLWRPRIAGDISDWLHDPAGEPPGCKDLE